LVAVLEHFNNYIFVVVVFYQYAYTVELGEGVNKGWCKKKKISYCC